MADGQFRNKSGYTVVLNNVARDGRLSLAAKGIYLMIQSYITMPDVQWKKSDFEKKCVEGAKAFDSCWKELKEAGYLKVHIIPDGKNFRVEFELMNEAVPGPHTFYYNKDGEIVSDNIEKYGKKETGKGSPEKDIHISNVQKICKKTDAEESGKAVGATVEADAGVSEEHTGYRIPSQRGYAGEGTDYHIPSESIYADRTPSQRIYAQGIYAQGMYAQGTYAEGGYNNNIKTDNINTLYKSSIINSSSDNSYGNDVDNSEEEKEKRIERNVTSDQSGNITVRFSSRPSGETKHGNTGRKTLLTPVPVIRRFSDEKTGFRVELDYRGRIDENEARLDIARNNGIQYKHAYSCESLVSDILFLANWNEHISRDDIYEDDMAAYVLLTENLIELASVKDTVQVKGGCVTYKLTIDRINQIYRELGNCEQAVERLFSRVIRKYKDFRAKMDVKNPKSYLKSVLWETMYNYRDELEIGKEKKDKTENGGYISISYAGGNCGSAHQRYISR